MSTRIRKAPLFLLLGLSIVVSSCHDSSGGSDETCNYKDDDWNGVKDDPYLDSHGRYFTKEHCGSCGIACDRVFPAATSTECVSLADPNETPHCEALECAQGYHLVASACVADQESLCLPCSSDKDCALLNPGAACLTLDHGGHFCGMACTQGGGECPTGFTCLSESSQCAPTSGTCACTPEVAGYSLGCWLEAPDGDTECPGEQLCDGVTLGECIPVIEEICDGLDNDCDGASDEDFMDGGVYVDDQHCGFCNHPCVPPAQNMGSECVHGGGYPVCVTSCLQGFVDLDGVDLNGCECEMTAASWPPTAHGGDGNCDGISDDMSNYIYVSKSGDDTNPGTLALPVLTIQKGIELATPGLKTVFVTQGTFDEQVELEAGVSMFGGYRSDFSDRDTTIYATVLVNTFSPPGHPVVTADGITVPTQIGGFTVEGSNAVATGTGSTAITLSECDNDLELFDLTVYAGSGQDGTDGLSSAQVLAAAGYIPAQLHGSNGTSGNGGINSYTENCTGLSVDGGNGGNKICPLTSINVSGGFGGDSSCPATGCSVGSPCGNGGCSDFMIGSTCDYAAVYAAAVPNPPAQDGFGPTGGDAGDLTYDAPTTIQGSSFCDDNPTLQREGGDGGDGGGGQAGSGGQGYNNPAGNFNVSSGVWRSGDGSHGTGGGDGSGGGGGTQGNGYDVIQSFIGSDRLGGSGGGGGSGGCGAPGAQGGEGGGSSIGIAVVLGNSSQGPNIHQVRVVPNTAGKGGDGGMGLAGGMPGNGGLGGSGNYWCARAGGKGGDGGSGGSGGGAGGGGGGSISGFHVVQGATSPASYVVTLQANNTVDPLPSPGSGGSAGYSPGNSGTSGVNGTAVAFRVYTSP